MLYAQSSETSTLVGATKGISDTLTCPMCHEPVIARCGQIKVWHFAHKVDSSCEMSRYGMTEWHYDWQMQFPEHEREIIITHNGVTHRADVIHEHPFGKRVFEFQRKMMPLDEMIERENFWMNQGYIFFWVFDCTKKNDNNELWFQLLRAKEGNDTTFKWRFAPPTVVGLRGQKLCDLGDGRVINIKTLHTKRRPYYGFGSVVKRERISI
jgi:competence CoiA-like predicted nuclease